MDWKRLIAERRVEAAPRASKPELDELRVMVERNLGDAELAGISDEGRFSMAYNAARLVAVMAIRVSGYRVKQPGAHFNTFQALAAVEAPGIAAMASYLDICRVKRNEVSYVRAHDVTGVEAAELLRKARQFWAAVKAWIVARRPSLAP